MKKKLDDLIQEALENIRNDRLETQALLIKLKEYMGRIEERHADSGNIAAKYVETLQRSNEQLVKVASLVHKKESTRADNSLSEEDKDSLFEIIKGQ